MKRTIKCIAVGDSFVGKSSLLSAYATNKLPRSRGSSLFESTDDYSVMAMSEGEWFSLKLFSTAGLEEYDQTRDSLGYPRADVFLVCFSVVDPVSFANVILKWIPEIRGFCRGTPFLLVGTQTDLRRDPDILADLAEDDLRPISFEQGQHLAKVVKAVRYLECSAWTKAGLRRVFDEALLAAVYEPDQAEKKSLWRCCW